ncbi:ATP-grasp domain-containing protein [Brachybacterium muris]|uniref:ATP-grasp domain-containing protein n=1 Tax=Brachybacterium muris TaxID=219301 RepID=UPI0021A50D4C|nr:ATP-grasp domain-containing protein [Brachybacterium muris]
MRKVLVLGALAGQVDAIETLKARGIEVHVCAHVPSGPGVEAADEFHLADIVDPDQIEAVAKSIPADVVYSVGSDIAMPTVVAVSERLGLPHFHGVELTDTLRRKQKLRDELDRAGLNAVKYAVVEPGGALPGWDALPCIVKPVDAQGQRGISIIDDPDRLEAAIVQAQESSVTGAAIIEEFLEGPEVSAHVIVEDGEVILFIPSDRHVWPGPMVGIPEGHSLPLGTETKTWEGEFSRLVQDVVRALGVKEGPLYFQAIVTSDGPRIVEIASRLDGCHLWRLLKFSTGFDIMDAVLGRLLGDPWPELPRDLAPEPATLSFLLDSPDVHVDDEYVVAHAKSDAEFTEIQVGSDGTPRRTNDVVARIGYQITRGA